MAINNNPIIRCEFHSYTLFAYSTLTSHRASKGLMQHSECATGHRTKVNAGLDRVQEPVVLL